MDKEEIINELKKLRISENHYRILLDESMDPTFSFYADGTYRYVNNAPKNYILIWTSIKIEFKSGNSCRASLRPPRGIGRPCSAGRRLLEKYQIGYLL